jgi:ubiquinone/menaquinone biosynthesis C-methylase UbiE
MKHRNNQKDASRRYHDRVARRYDAIYDDPYWEFHDRVTWDLIKPHLPSDMSARCCDLGCGTGKWGMKFLKSGFATTFVDHSAAMIEQTRAKLAALGGRESKATLLVADIVDLSALESDQFDLVVAMGDPLSICSDSVRAAREMARICKPGGVIIATADNKLAATDHFLQQGDIDALEAFVKSSRTRWLTQEENEKFELTTFTPAELQKLMERAGLESVKVIGKTVLPVRQFKHLLETEGVFARLLRMEQDLAKDPSSAARAAHLQAVGRKPKANE